jgi:hypothetical protein
MQRLEEFAGRHNVKGIAGFPTSGTNLLLPRLQATVTNTKGGAASTGKVQMQNVTVFCAGTLPGRNVSEQQFADLLRTISAQDNSKQQAPLTYQFTGALASHWYHSGTTMVVVQVERDRAGCVELPQTHTCSWLHVQLHKTLQVKKMPEMLHDSFG